MANFKEISIEELDMVNGGNKVGAALQIAGGALIIGGSVAGTVMSGGSAGVAGIMGVISGFTTIGAGIDNWNN